MSVALVINNQGTTTVRFERNGTTIIAEVVEFFREWSINVISVTINTVVPCGNGVMIDPKCDTVSIRLKANQSTVGRLIAIRTEGWLPTIRIMEPPSNKKHCGHLRLATSR